MVLVSHYANDEPLLSTASAYASTSATVSLYVDGSRHSVSTNAQTVGDVISQFQVHLQEGDVVEPGLDHPIDQTNYNINVYRAVPVLIVDGDKHITTRSGYHSSKQILAAAGVQVYPEDQVTTSNVTDFTQDDLVGRKVIIKRATPAQIVLAGKTYNVRTQAKFVRDLLHERGIAISSQDQVNVNPDERIRNGSRIIINRSTQDTAVLHQTISADTQVVYDDNLDVGVEKVQNPGSDGVMELTYLVSYTNKKETGRSLLEQKVIKNPVNRIVIRGKRTDGDIWLRLRLCESGGDYSRNSGNGYYGAYQFSASTWNKYNTGYATANLAPPDVQDRVAKLNVQLSAGGFWSQHPGCSRILKLPQKP